MDVVAFGILGGTFDPIHNGHIAVARAAQDALKLDRVVFAPVATPPHKRQRLITPIEYRWEMVSLAVAEYPHFVASRVDIDRPPPQYSVDTIRLLIKKYGASAAETFFIIGADALAGLPHWKNPAGVVSQCQIAVVHRPGFRPHVPSLFATIPQLQSRLQWVAMPSVPISATEIRQRVGQGLPIDDRVPPAVAEYIARRRLYHPPSDEKQVAHG